MKTITVLQNLNQVKLAEGEVLFRQDDQGAFMYLVISGSLQADVESQDGHTQPLGVMGPGDLVGEIHFLSGGGRTATLTAIEPAELLEITRQAYDELAVKDPDFYQKLEIASRQRLCNGLMAVIGEWA